LPRSRLSTKVGCIVLASTLAGLVLTTGCGYAGSAASSDPPDTPSHLNVVSLNPQDWDILYSLGMPSHPSADPAGAWSFSFPMLPPSPNNSQSFPPGTGAVGYVMVPFEATIPLHEVTITFEVENSNAQYYVFDPADHPPATFRLMFAVRGFNLSDANNRWWGSAPYFNNDGFNSGGYDLGSRDNQVLVMSIPLTPDRWSNVLGQQDSQAFYAALKNVGWFGLTFGGQFFAGHGVALSSGSAKFILINYVVN
jgi:hypothetical protein